MKRNQRFLSYAVTNPGLPRQMIVKQRRHIHAICPLGSRRQAQHKPGPQTGQHSPPRRRLSMMHLIYDGIIKMQRFQAFQMLRSRQFLHRSHHQIAVQLLLSSHEPAAADRPIFGIQNSGQRGFRLRQNLCPMSHHQHSGPAPQMLPDLQHIQRRQPRLAHPGCHSHQTTLVPAAPQLLQLQQRLLLPGPRSQYHAFPL